MSTKKLIENSQQQDQMDSSTQMDSKAKIKLSDESKENSNSNSDSASSKIKPKVTFSSRDREEAKHKISDSGKTTRSNYPSAITNVLMGWLKTHVQSPYPSEEDRISL
mmetsp:Transcript_14775/g.17094  ORF Transcript_14775/g.17094 Transcript_14775/m.17094 type:complete len:108 (+) Transcript_14775:158-481(+)